MQFDKYSALRVGVATKKFSEELGVAFNEEHKQTLLFALTNSIGSFNPYGPPSLEEWISISRLLLSELKTDEMFWEQIKSELKVGAIPNNWRPGHKTLIRYMEEQGII